MPEIRIHCKLSLAPIFFLLSSSVSSFDPHPPAPLYFSWQQEKYACKTWIWVDLVRDYVEQMINYRTSNSVLQNMEQAISAVEREMVQKDRAHQNEICALVQEVLLRSHLSNLRSP